MKRGAGFTLIELLITMTIMVILLVLTVVSLRGNQVYARDEKRKTDVAIIAQNLENYYRNGSTSAVFTYTPGRYPPTAYMTNEADVRLALRDIDPSVLRAPGVAATDAISLTNATTTNIPSPSIKTYVYQPLKGDGTLCTTAGSDCRRFNLFYKLESDGTVQKVTSKNQ
jgi:prepilin-type N-terminal cleavage/methylation domain-containing protein